MREGCCSKRLDFGSTDPVELQPIKTGQSSFDRDPAAYESRVNVLAIEHPKVARVCRTPQHLAGIGSATRLIAINSDPDAAIFQYAEAGAVADARVLLPLLVEALEGSA